MNAFASILVFVSIFGALNARDARLTADCLSGARSAKDCCATVPNAWYAHLQHPTNCRQFFHCDHGAPVLKDCPAGLHWSVAKDRCEWPALANCKSAGDPATSGPPATTTTTRPLGGNCRTANISNDCRYGKARAEDCCVGVPYWQDALMPNEANCGTYIQCVHQKPMVRPCPAGLHWSPSTCQCDWPSIAKCNGIIPDPAPTTEAPTTTTEKATTAAPPPTNAGTSSCSTAHISNECRYGNARAEDCCVGVKYWEDALLPNDADCGTYIQCVHEKPMVRPCPAGLHWSPNTCQCDWPAIAKCNGTIVVPTTTTTTTQKPTTPEPTTTTTTKPTTTTTIKPTTTAPPTTDDGKSSCSTAHISNECRYGNARAEDCCVGVKYWEDALLPNDADCGTYIQCVHEKPMVRPCPAGLHWSPSTCQCDWPAIAKCNGTIVVPTTTTTTEAPTKGTPPAEELTTIGKGSGVCGTGPVADDCRYGHRSAHECCVGVPYWEDVLLPNPGNCGTYLQCVHERPMVRICPDGLHWNPVACYCDWPSNAQCLNP